MSKAAELARRLGQNAEAACRHYLPKGRKQGRYWLVGDVTGAPGRSLYVRLSGERAGNWVDAATAQFGDLLDLIALNRGLEFRAALDEAQNFLRLPIAESSSIARETPAPTGSPDAARRLFAASRPISGTLAESYLRSRGLVLPRDISALRFHPRCFHHTPSGRELWPALIAAVTDLGGAVTGVHRTWLDPSGGKAPLAQPRRAMGRLLGNGVRFKAARDVLMAAEGVETTLALKTIMPAMPMVAALSAAHLAALILPPTLRRLYVARDNDEAGRLAVQKLRERHRHRDIDIRALTPRAEDFNADLLTLGADRLGAWIAKQVVADDIARFLIAHDWL
ncbi:MAG: DNA primase [Alphaproteobacteria bacterium]|nr:DNA primase [Alphaproteobacteria bacterium]